MTLDLPLARVNPESTFEHPTLLEIAKAGFASQLLSPLSQVYNYWRTFAYLIGVDQEGDGNYAVKTRQLDLISIYT